MISDYNYKLENKKRSSIGFLLFFSLYLVLPDYFALEISESLPLITASRIILLVWVGGYLIKKKYKISFKLCSNRRIDRAIKIYVIGMIIVNICNFGIAFAPSFKEILSIFLEKYIVVLIISKTITSRQRFIKALKILVYSSGVVAFVTIIGCLLGTNFFYYLTTTKREMLQASFVRLGLLRAEAGFGHAVYYGAYCLLMIVISGYLLRLVKKTYERRLLFCVMIFDIVALLLSNSRGSLVAGLIIATLYLLRNGKKYTASRVEIGLVALFGVGILSLASMKIRGFISKIFLSIVAIFDKSIQLANYGANSNGMKSRFAQLQSFTYVLKNRPLFGFGARVIERQSIKVNWLGNMLPLSTIDMGVVYTVSQYGYIGLIIEIYLCYILLRYLIKGYRKDLILEMFLMLIITYLIELLTISGIDNVFWVIIGLIVAYANIYKNLGINSVESDSL